MTTDNVIKNGISNSLKSEDNSSVGSLSITNESSNNLSVKTFEPSFSWKGFFHL